MKLHLVLCSAHMSVLPLAGHAQTPPTATTSPVTPAPITLRMKFTPGEVLRYKMTTDMDMTTAMIGKPANAPSTVPPMNQRMEANISETVQSVNPTDGSATLVVHTGNLTATMNGKPIPGMAAIIDGMKGDSTMTMAPSGKVLSMKMPLSSTTQLPAGMDISKLSGMAGNALPVAPVRVGDTWGSNNDLSPALGQLPGAAGMKMTMLSTLAGIDIGAQTVANISQTYNGTINTLTPILNAGTLKMTGNLSGSGSMKFDVTGGSITSQDSTMTMNITTILPKASSSSTAPPQTMKMLMQETIHMERLDGDAPKA